jgi:hypothetical protein
MHATRLVLNGFIALTFASSFSAALAQGPRHATLVEEVRRATDRFKDPAAATSAGYAPFLGCVSGPQDGAMGMHYVNGTLVNDGALDPLRPEALMYESKGGRLQLLGVEYIVLADAWNAANKTPPALLGQLFHYTPSPNRYGIPAFYALHVWAWRDNPNGMFADWNPRVSCAEHAAEAPAAARH